MVLAASGLKSVIERSSAISCVGAITSASSAVMRRHVSAALTGSNAPVKMSAQRIPTALIASGAMIAPSRWSR